MPLKLPEYYQDRDWDCGRALFLSICKFWKVKSLGWEDLANPYSGLTPDSFEAGLRAVDLSVFSGTLSIELLRAITRSGVPVACLIEDEGVGHWIGVEGATPNSVVVWCPTDGRIKIPKSVFDRKWVCTHFMNGVYSSWGIAAHI